MGAIDLPQLRGTDDLLDHKQDAGLLGQFLRSAAYAGVEAPTRALAQIADHYTDAGLDQKVQNGFKSIGLDSPPPAKFNTSDWYAQQAGGAVGMMIPFLALRGGVKAAAGGIFGEAAISHVGATVSQFAAKEALIGGATGLAYGTFFSPSKAANVGSSSFYADRAKAGLADMASFAALSYTSPFIGVGLNALAAPIERSALSPLTKNLIEGTLRGPVLPGVVSGLPAGVISAEINAIKDGRLIASGTEFTEAIVGMSFVGGAMGSASWMINRQASSNLHDAAALKHEVVKNAFSTMEARLKAQMDLEARGGLQGKATPHSDFDRSRAAATLRAIGEPDLAALNKTDAKSKPASATAASATEQISKPAQVAEATPAAELFKKMDAVSSQRRATSTLDIDALLKESTSKDAAIKAGSDKISNPEKLPGFEVVLGASGVEAPAHIGFLRALEERKIPISKVMGASGGALVATFYANGYTSSQLNKILLSNEFRYPSVDVLAKCFHLQDPWNLFPYAIDFKPWLQELVKKYDLKPQDNLRIVAAEANTNKPVIFEGKNYDLATALAASTAATTIGMKPVWHEGRSLVDGVYYHPIPADLAKAPSLVSKIGFASKLPLTALSPWDYLMHLREMGLSSHLNSKFPDPKGHIITQTGLPDVSTSTFGISTETLNRLVKHGYDATKERLTQPDAVDAISKREPAKKN